MLNKIENRKMKNKIENPLPRMTKKREKTQIFNLQIATTFTEILRIMSTMTNYKPTICISLIKWKNLQEHPSTNTKSQRKRKSEQTYNS